MHEDFNTPMMRQYKQIKGQYPDCILLFRLGDFYEMFLEDALVGSRVLDITLTSRDRGKDGRIPMCGVPYHALDSYLSRLVRSGHKVAICEQLSDPSASKLVDRGVVRVVTPGTLLDEHSLSQKENNYIASIHIDDKFVGFALADLSTGFFKVTEYPISKLNHLLSDELAKYNPAEFVLSPVLYDRPDLLKLIKTHKNINITNYSDWELNTKDAGDYLQSHFKVKSLEGFGISLLTRAHKAAAGLLSYLRYTQKDKLSQIKTIGILDNSAHVVLDRSTIINLELFSTIREGGQKGTFLDFFDNTLTAMGGRLIRQWIQYPLSDVGQINSRLNCVTQFLYEPKLTADVKSLLTGINDIERIFSRLAGGIGNPKDLVSLKQSFIRIWQLKELLTESSSPILSSLVSEISEDISKIAKYINNNVVEDPPFDPKSGGLLKPGVFAELDNLKNTIKSSKEFILNMEIQERKKTGISTLKVRYNQVFGYYIEITKAQLKNVPDYYVRKQTLVNAERFITPELKRHEEIIISNQEEIKSIEYKCFLEIIDRILSLAPEIQKAAYVVAYVDCLISVSHISSNGSYVRPEFIDTGSIHIAEGRHPVVETMLPQGSFVSNDVVLNDTDHQLLIITGPNMAGKSVYIRQVALLVLMAQIGSYIPAKSATLSVVDRIFVRSGASDVITSGLSTFMVEMVETANILNNATDKSLIVMDEIGRGTSTYDGISIAWSVASYLVTSENYRPKTLFATHYHELQELETKYPDRIKNYQVVVKESSGDPVFLHKVKPGRAAHSFGIAVAKLAGLPESVCIEAFELLEILKSRASGSSSEIPDLVSYLKEIDLVNTTPIEALNILSKLKNLYDR